MSRTYRNRHAVPTGLTVNDGCDFAIDSNGIKYYPSADNNWNIRYIVDTGSWYHLRCQIQIWEIGYHGIEPENYFENYEPDEDFIEEIEFEYYAPPFRASFCCKESKANRKTDWKNYRSKVRAHMDREDWEMIPRHRKTCGWLTW